MGFSCHCGVQRWMRYTVTFELLFLWSVYIWRDPNFVCDHSDVCILNARMPESNNVSKLGQCLCLAPLANPPFVGIAMGDLAEALKMVAASYELDIFNDEDGKP